MTTGKNADLLPDVPAYAAAFRELDAVQTALLNILGHLQLVDQKLWNDFAELPAEYQPAAVVLHDATKAVDALHTRLDKVNVALADVRHGPGWRARIVAESRPRGNGARRARS